MENLFENLPAIKSCRRVRQTYTPKQTRAIHLRVAVCCSIFIVVLIVSGMWKRQPDLSWLHAVIGLFYDTR